MSAAIAAPVGYARPTVPWNGLTVTDLFCGAGGSSSGLVEAGYRVVIAANHWALAIESHQINHPDTDHSQADISQVNPAYFPKTHVLWGSPECTNHSIAKGVKRQRQQDQALFELDGTRPCPTRPRTARARRCGTFPDSPSTTATWRSSSRTSSTRTAGTSSTRGRWRCERSATGMQLVWLNSMHAQIGGLP
ncbi:DNA methyltransferase, partial [Microbacterium sp. SUBG005]